MSHALRVVLHGSRITHYRYSLRITHYSLRITHFILPWNRVFMIMMRRRGLFVSRRKLPSPLPAAGTHPHVRIMLRSL